MSDPNNRNRMAIKEIATSPVSADETVDTTCASTVGTASQHPAQVAQSAQPEPNSGEIMRRQVLHLGLASSGAASLFVVSVVPLNILLGLAVVLILWATFFIRLYQMARVEYQRALRGRGLGNLLPASFYDSLVNTSFHEFMTDATFARENQHFMLYFIPGLNREQLDAYVDRLVPRHRRRLHRPGLGNFLGPGFMRHVIGEQGIAQRQRDQLEPLPQRPALEYVNSSDTADDSAAGEDSSTTRRLVPRRLELEVINEDAASRLDDDEAWGDVAPRGSAVEADDMSDESENLSVEEELVVDAAVSGAVTFFNFALGYSQHAVARSVVQTSRRILGATLGLGLVTVGAGALGIYSGHLSTQDFRIPNQLSRETRNMIMSSTIASGATAGLFVLFGYARSPPPPPLAKSPSEKSKKKN